MFITLKFVLDNALVEKKSYIFADDDKGGYYILTKHLGLTAIIIWMMPYLWKIYERISLFICLAIILHFTAD
jgi:hypothetical protein